MMTRATLLFLRDLLNSATLTVTAGNIDEVYATITKARAELDEELEESEAAR